MKLCSKLSPKLVPELACIHPTSVPNFSWIRVRKLESICDLCKNTNKKKKNKGEKTKTLVFHISETPGAIYFNFGIQPPFIGGHFHSKFGDL